MKKVILAFLLIVVLLFQAACVQGDEATVISPYPTEGRETKLVGDSNLSGELTISVFDKNYDVEGGYQTGDQINAAAKKFSELYPSVKLDIERWYDGKTNISDSLSDYLLKLSTEIMAGSGPDVFKISGGMDVNKMMRSGKLADLKDYFEDDINFNISDYNEAVFSGGQPEGKQYIVPASYSIPLIMSSMEALKSANFNIDKCNTVDGQIKEFTKLLNNISLERPREKLWNAPFFISNLPLYISPKYINYEMNEVNLSSAELKTAYEFAKTFFVDIIENDMYYSAEESNVIPYNWKNGQAVLIEYTGMCFNDSIDTARFSAIQKQTPVIFPLINDNRGVTATVSEKYVARANTPNIKHAYNFLKILINPEIQTTDYYKPYNIPISNIAKDIFFERASGNLNDQYFSGDIGMINLPPVSEEFIAAFRQAINKINGVIYNSNDTQSILRQEMLPFYTGEKTYDECIKNAQEALEIYVSE